MESPECLVIPDVQANLVRMAWTSNPGRLNASSLASFALRVNPGLEALREKPEGADPKESLAILDFLAVMATQDRWDPPGQVENRETLALPVKRVRPVTMPLEELELLGLVDPMAPAVQKDHLDPEDFPRTTQERLVSLERKGRLDHMGK